MNLFYGELVRVLHEEETVIGLVRTGGAMQKIPLGLLTDAKEGDRVLVCDGVAIARVVTPDKLEEKDVPCDPGKAS